jgi:hypothetical protein
MFVLVPFLCHCICASDYLIDIFIYVLTPCVKMPWLFETKTCPDRYENYTEIREDCNNRNNGVRLLLTMYDGMGGGESRTIQRNFHSALTQSTIGYATRKEHGTLGTRHDNAFCFIILELPILRGHP